jgi:PiT family inorganic phosphate transporter
MRGSHHRGSKPGRQSPRPDATHPERGGAGKRGGVVHWSVVGQMVTAWVITLPSAGLVGAAAWNISNIFGKNSDVGAIVIAALCAATAFGLWTLSKRNRVTAEDLDRTNITPELEAERAMAASPALA